MTPGNERSNMAGIPLVLKLKKSLYGLCQRFKNWFRTMNQFLGDIMFRPLKFDPFVCICEGDVGFVILALYVCEFFLLGTNKLLPNKLNK